MKIKILGTAASEGIPAVFCNCKVCKNAISAGGKNIRMRSGTMVDSDMLIEYGPDLLAHRLNHKLPLHKVKHLLISHAHTDHFVPTELEMMAMPVLCERDPATIHIYGNEKVAATYYNSGLPYTNQFEMHILRENEPIIAGDKKITPLKAEHDAGQNCYVFLIEKESKTFFYGHDSGFYGERTWSNLKGKRIDLAVLDCVAAMNGSYYNHMGIDSNIMVRDKMLKEGIANGETKFVITHFSHHNGFSHEEIEAEASVHSLIAAYDGMEFEL